MKTTTHYTYNLNFKLRPIVYQSREITNNKSNNT